MIKDDALESFGDLLEKFNGQIRYAHHGRGEESINIDFGRIEIHLMHEAGPGVLEFAIIFRSPALESSKSVMGAAVVSCLAPEALAGITGSYASPEGRKERLANVVKFLLDKWGVLVSVTPEQVATFKGEAQRLVEDSLRKMGVKIDDPSVWARYFPSGSVG